MNDHSSGPSFWRTVWLLLRTARRRSAGRRQRQQQLLQNKGSSSSWSGFGVAIFTLVMCLANIFAALLVKSAVSSGQRIEVERQSKIVVSGSFLNELRSAGVNPDGPSDYPNTSPFEFGPEARDIAEDYGGDKTAIEEKLEDSVRNHGTRDLITKDDAMPGLTALPRTGRLPAMLGSIALLWWVVMLVCQGEGLELDLQRRRHPVWEWLFSHPVPQGAVFLADMLSPIAANPIYWGAPLFVGVLYGFIYDAGVGFIAAILIGVPITIALACLGKAIEIAVILRFAPRTRGAIIGLMSWLGYSSLTLLFIGWFFVPKVIGATSKFVLPFTALPWPWLGIFLGEQSTGSFSFLIGLLTCWVTVVVTIAGAVSFSVWGAQRGLAGNFGSDVVASPRRKRAPRFGRDPLYRKEFLWFIRDRSAIVQTILIPITAASFQLFNFRGILSEAQGAWNYLCGAAILFGTYFLWILGPKSLTSEGTALWIAMTWPRGLESLLKAKAWLWAMISMGIVSLVLCYAIFVFPHAAWRIALVGVGWFFFARSMSEKSVTLVTVASSSGEPEKVPTGRRWAAQLGMATFAIGIITQQWHLAIVGIVYSFLTAAAMWQNFRARLPYLYDPWSEQLPPAPTLMHAMIGISVLVEAVAVVSAILLGIFAVADTGRESLPVVVTISYGICAAVVSYGMAEFLGNRGVTTADVWSWESDSAESNWGLQAILGSRPGLLRLLAVGASLGIVLALFADTYLLLLQHLPFTSELIRKGHEQMAKIPNFRLWFGISAVGFAPFAEEYLFRGLLFRALDREWGGWRAILGSAAFFTIYHPVLSWMPVFFLGATNAYLFKKTRRLAPAVALHMVYNLIVVFT